MISTGMESNTCFNLLFSVSQDTLKNPIIFTVEDVYEIIPKSNYVCKVCLPQEIWKSPKKSETTIY